MSIDYRMTMERQVINQDNLINEYAIQCSMKYLQDRLTAAGKSLQDFELPLPQNQQNDMLLKYRDIMNVQDFNIAEEADYQNTHEPLLNEEQATIFQFICGRLDTGSSSLVFIDAPEGTGKTLIKLILFKVRSS